MQKITQSFGKITGIVHRLSIDESDFEKGIKGDLLPGGKVPLYIPFIYFRDFICFGELFLFLPGRLGRGRRVEVEGDRPRAGKGKGYLILIRCP